MRKAGLPLQRLLTLEHLTAVANYVKLPDVAALYAAVGEGTVGAQAVINRLISVEGGEERSPTRSTRTGSSPASAAQQKTVGRADSGIEVDRGHRPAGQAGQVLYAGAGRPDHGLRHQGRRGVGAPGRLRQRGEPAEGARAAIGVEWAPTAKSSFLVAIQVEALDRNRLLSDITRALSDQHVNILSAGLSTTKDRICRARFTFETADPTHLDHVLRAVRSVPAVFDVYRIRQ